MTTPLAHPLVSSYLRDLELLLHGVDPVERADVLGGVREHLDAALLPGTSDDGVRATLAELGSPHTVADEAYAGRPAPAVTPPPRTSLPVTWQASAATTFNAVGATLLALMVWAGFQSSDDTMPLLPHPAELLAGALFFAIPWISIVVLSLMTDAWAQRDKLLSIWLYPGLATGLVLVSIPAGRIGPLFVLLVAQVLVLGAGVWAVVRLWRATRRVSQ